MSGKIARRAEARQQDGLPAMECRDIVAGVEI
jgi:hypothetical protein